MKRLVCAIIALFSLTINISSSEYYFSHINGEIGLSHNNVKSILQDHYGFMWFGTRNKLNRYDGVSIKTFDCSDFKIGKGNNNISAIAEIENQLWLGTDKGVVILNLLTESFESFDKITNNNIALSDWVADIKLDNKNNVWIVVPNQGLFRYNLTDKQLEIYTVVDELKPSINNPQCMAIDDEGKIWVGTNGSGIFLYNASNNNFTQYLGDSQGTHSLQGKNIYKICHQLENIIIGVHEENLMYLNKRNNIVKDFDTPEINNTIIRDVKVLNGNEIWVATQSGIFIIKNNRLENVRQDLLDKHSLSSNIIECFYQDREGGIWVATNFGGVNYLPKRNNIFHKYYPTSQQGAIKAKRIKEICEGEDGRIWFSSEDDGLSVFNPVTNNFEQITGLKDNKTLALLVQDNKIWTGYFKNGIDLIDSHSRKVTHYNKENLSLNEESVYALCKDREGNIWLGNGQGVHFAPKGSMQFTHIKAFGICYTFDILEDSEGYIWVATMGGGIFQHNPKLNTTQHYVAREEGNSIASNSVSSITEDHLGQIWFSTDRGGICVFNKKDKTFKNYSTKDGLPDDIAYRIVEDREHNLWFGTNNGLVKFDPQTLNVKTYTQNDGLLSNQFNYKSALVATDGTLYFGCVEGLISFRPNEFKVNNFVPPVYITEFSIFNKEVFPNQGNSPIQQSIIHTNKIDLSYEQSNISFRYVALSYTSPTSNNYSYKMEGIDKEWVHSRNNHTASYAQLPPGEYSFMVKGSNSDGVWSDKVTSIQVVVHPPWWSSNIAYVCYLVLICSAIYLVIRYYLNKYKRKALRLQHIFKIEKERELYEVKVNFFTEIAHEIRTPITLISGPLENIMKMEINDKQINYNLSIIEQNTKNLLSLINQLLDFRKVDSKKLRLHFRQTDITSLLKETIKSFSAQIILTQKDISEAYPEENISAIADKDALKKIFNNLISNAIKYSEKTIKMVVNIESEYFVFQIMNDGALVPEEYKDNIFDPFFQLQSSSYNKVYSSGIGLSISRSLTELHCGYLSYSSRDSLNIFTLRIPLNLEESHEATLHSTTNKIDEKINIEPEAIEYETMPSLVKKDKKTVLIVEDNVEMLDFMSSNFEDDYILELASNGLEALDILKKKSIDLVVSDVMMDGMNGFELCEFIKSNENYSHIIVVLLTAKNDLNSKIKGLQIGADAYVEKPFSVQYLDTLIQSLIINRQRELETFMKKPYIPIQASNINKGDEEFLIRISEIIHDNITDSNFNVEMLADALHMSRSSLHRKMKATTDTAPTDFIRLVRVQKAAQLIIEGKHRINEICYLVGINTPSYLIKIFQNQYGMTPKEFEKSQKNKND